MAVLAPIPSASVSTPTTVKPGFFSNWRKAKRRSFIQAMDGERRMPNDKCRKNDKARISKRFPLGNRLCFRHWDFGFLLSFGIRHSSFNSESDHRVHARRAARRDHGRKQRDGDQDRGVGEE